MFTGIVQQTGIIRSIKPNKNDLVIEVNCNFSATCHIDESIAINGVCHTVVAYNDSAFTVNSIPETLRKTTMGELKPGEIVNLERSLTLQKGIEGHLVQGHVDGIGDIRKIVNLENDTLLRIGYPKEFASLIVPQGSITVDGISLTIARVHDDFSISVAIIPYTWEHTNLKLKGEGGRVNLEFDIIGKYVARYMQAWNKP